MAEWQHSPAQIGMSLVDKLRKVCRYQAASLYAILDACDEPRVLEKVRELGPDRAVSLYHGWAEREYCALAPYLVQIDEGLLDWIIENLWDDPWGIFAVANTDLPSVRKHFRRFLAVQDSQGARLYFRYYDPRVLSAFLNSCSNSDAKTFFGPLEAFVIPRGRPTCLFEYTRDKNG